MKYLCTVCGYVYDEAVEPIPFLSLPQDWRCPVCQAPRSAFQAEGEEMHQAPTASFSPVEDPSDLRLLTPGQLSAIFSNLARGAEKQYRPEEQALFLDLAESYRTLTAPEPEASVQSLYALLEEDLSTWYPTMLKTAEEASDRGTARICVWGEKVTRMLHSLIERYLQEGEAFLKDTPVWICTICGFLYVGPTPPEICPVCKVPSWKFEQVEGRKAI